ncbi:MAG: hypothetical protein J0H57_26505 [Rhodospirillales bacterium]|nr:hypothetical protein [Rhodospirillales bacterium]
MRPAPGADWSGTDPDSKSRTSGEIAAERGRRLVSRSVGTAGIAALPDRAG